MEKRALIAIALSFLVLVVWTKLFPPPERPPAPEPVALEQPLDERDPVRRDPSADAGSRVPAEASAGTAEAQEPIAAVAEEEIRIEQGPYNVVLTNHGGRARSWKLRDYTTRDGDALDLVPHFENASLMPLSIDLDDATLAADLNDAMYRVERQTVGPRDGRGTGEQVRFTWNDGQGLAATKSFTFWEEGWLIDVELEVLYRGRVRPARLAVGPGFAAQESREGKSTYYYESQGLWNVDGRVERRKRKKLVDEDGGISARVRWAGLEDQYFAALIVPGDGPAQVRWRSIEVTPTALPGIAMDEQNLESLREPMVAVTIPEGGAELFMGPKNYKLLHGLGFELEKAVWFATNPFLAWVSRHIFLALIWIHDHVAPNYGLAIILATVFLRLLLFPVNQYSMVSMKKAQIQMQRLQPKIKAIRAKYKKSKDAQSRAKMNQETMDLYKREGVNPMGGVTGCLPMLAQFPILIGFYNMLTVAVELRGAPFFGWILDLSQKDPLWITPLLMGVTMFAQQKMAMSKVKDPMQQQQQKIMMFMPIVFTYICLQMPSGMVLYWFINNLLGIGQQWLVNRHTGRLEAAEAQKA